MFTAIKCESQKKLIFKNHTDSIFCYKVYPWLSEKDIFGLIPPEEFVKPIGEPLDSLIKKLEYEICNKKSLKNDVCLSVIIDSLGKCRGVVFDQNMDDIIAYKVLDYFSKVQYVPAKNRGIEINYWFTVCLK